MKTHTHQKKKKKMKKREREKNKRINPVDPIFELHEYNRIQRDLN